MRDRPAPAPAPAPGVREAAPLPRDPAAALLAAMPGEGFGAALLAHVRQAAEIADLGAFLVTDLSAPDPVLSLWSGRMSDYWFNRNARRIASHEALRRDFVERIRQAPPGALALERWAPPPDDPRAPIYARDGAEERVSVASRLGRGGVVSFYLRGAQAGPLTEAEMTRLRAALPLTHELIVARLRMVGVAGATAAMLRARGAPPFAALSAREAEACDHAVRGLTVAGTASAMQVSENSVRTFRKRAWAKLGVASAAELTARVLSARG